MSEDTSDILTQGKDLSGIMTQGLSDIMTKGSSDTITKGVRVTMGKGMHKIGFQDRRAG